MNFEVSGNPRQADLRIVHVVGAMDRAGTETMIMNLYRSIDRDRVQFDFLVHEDRLCDYDEEICDLGGVIRRIPRFTGVNLGSYRKASREALARFSDDPIVHGHIGSCAPVYLSEAKRMGRATVAHSHAQHFPLSPSQVAFRIASYPTRFIADEFLACSRQAGLDRFGSEVVEGSHFHVLNNGIQVDKYACTNEEHERAKASLGMGEGPIVGHVGRLTEIKNHDYLFDVFQKMLLHSPHAHLLLYGRGEDEDRLRKEVEDKGLSERIHFCGLTDNVPLALKAMDVMIFPSFKEGLPVTLVETQATGLPCVISSGVPEAAVLGDSVRRMPLSDGSDAWAAAAFRLMDEACDRSVGVDTVRGAGFDVATSADWLTGFYRELAERTARFV